MCAGSGGVGQNRSVGGSGLLPARRAIPEVCRPIESLFSLRGAGYECRGVRFVVTSAVPNERTFTLHPVVGRLFQCLVNVGAVLFHTFG